MAHRGSLTAALLYIFTAVGLVLFNKNVFSGKYSLNLPTLMPLVQQVVIFVGLVVLDRWNIIAPLPAVNGHTLRVMLPISVAFLFYLVLGMLALWGVSIPMYASLRRFTVVFVMFFDYAISRLTHSQLIVLTVGIQVLGCVMAAVNDIEYDPRG